MVGYYVSSKAEVAAKVAELLHDGDTVAVGGSMSLAETGVMDLLRSGRYRFLDRYAPGLSAEEVQDIYRQSFFACHLYTSGVTVIDEGGRMVVR